MPNRTVSWNSPVVVFAVVFCLVLGTATLVTRALYANGRQANPASSAPATSFVANWRELAAVGQAEGSRAAPVSVVVFADYQCPGCAALHSLLRAAQDSLPGVLRVVRRHYPLSSHPHAVAAANAAECAAEQGRFREFENVVYAGQDSIGLKPWTAFAAAAGVRNETEFEQCTRSRRHAAVVERDLTVARELKLQGTPVYIVNGVSNLGAPTLTELLTRLRNARARTAADGASSSDTSASLHGASTSVAPTAGTLRRWGAPLEHERTITGPDQDQLLIPSGLTATRDGGLVVFDFGDMEIRAFNRQGDPLWRAGRKGSGPGEFRNAMDVKVRATGDLAVLDMGNRRITTLSPSGRVLRTIPLQFSSHRFVPLPDTSLYVLAADDSSSFWIGVNARGDSTRRTRIPALLSTPQPIERESFSAPLADGAVVVFRWSGRFALLGADGAVRQVVEGVEPVAFPGVRSYPLKSGKFSGLVHRISPHATPGALSVTTQHNEIFVLFGGASVNRGRIVDVYQASSGAYVRSHLLPHAVLELAALPDGSFATLRSDPIPAIEIWTVSGAHQQ